MKSSLILSFSFSPVLNIKKALLAGSMLLMAAAAQAQKAPGAEVWLTNADQSALFQKQKQTLVFSKPAGKDSTINLLMALGFALPAAVHNC
jgi:hypothetical protein